MADNDQQDYLHWRSRTDDGGYSWLCLDKANSSANVLSEQVLREFEQILTTLEAAPPSGVIIYSGKDSGFVMGADLNEFQNIETAEQAYELIRVGQDVFTRVENLRCPTVAVLNGFALGGGLELAMACKYRLALANRKPVIGFPEVQLGLHPGFGGTVRSVRIAGVRAAMELMLTGNPIRVEKARAQGFIDGIVTAEEWREAAIEVLTSGRAARTASAADKLLNLPFTRPFVATALRKQVAKRARREHYPAPYAIIDLWLRHGASKKSYPAEARSFAELMIGETSRNLVRVFFLQNRLKSQGSKPATTVERLHVVGAGVMGGDIAAWCALRGLQVSLQDRERSYIDPALQRAAKLFSKKIPDSNDRAAASDRLVADVPGRGAADADLVIEAIFEDREAKQSLYETLQSSMKPGAILATNTSSIPLEELRMNLAHPQRFIGLHFFNPVAKLPLVEVVRCDDTEQAILDRAFAFVKAIGKFPLECRSSPGFVVNRVLAPYMAEAMRLVESGVPLVEIDRAAEEFGMPMGPIELIDSVGLDVAMQVSQVLSKAFGREVPDILSGMVARNHLGRKSGQGFYAWQEGKAIKPEAGEAAATGDITDRLILPMVNESVACLAEGVVSDADLLDAGVIFGTGFAPFRGGPLNYARTRGVDEVVRKLEQLAASTGDDGGRFRPHPGWEEFRTSAGS